MEDFYQYMCLVFCILFPLFWFFFIFEEHHGPLGKSDIPGDFGHFVIGEAYEFFQDPLDFAYSRFAKYGHIFKTKLLGHGVVFVGGSKGLELFASGPEKGLGACPESFIFELPAHNFNINNHKRSVLMSESDNQHGFKHLAILSSITSICNQEKFFNECKEVIMQILSTESLSNRPICGSKICKDIFLNISVTILMKDTSISHKNQLNGLISRWLKMQNIFPFSPFSLNRPWESGKQAATELDALISSEVKSRLCSDREFGSDLIGTMLETAMRRSDGYSENLQNIIEKTIIAECWTVIYSVSVHVAGACCWLLVCFERFKNMKEAALTEVRNNPDCLLFDSIRSRGSLPYLEAIIEESLRMYGFLSHPQLRRVALLDIPFESHTIPRGTPVMLSLNSFNFLDEYFADAHIFKPERFLSRKEGDYLNSDRKTSFSFGVGHHTCPGDNLSRMLLKLVAVILLEQYDTSADSTQSFKPVYPRGMKSKREGNVASSEDFYFPVPQDLLMYDFISSRQKVTSQQLD